MAITKTKIKFSIPLKKWGESIFNETVEEQTRRLIAYAEEKIKDLGEVIQMHNSRNHMDDKGNLLDSLCWGVTYNGEYKGSGFYREQRATEGSTMHEWSKKWGGEYFERKGKRSQWREVNILSLPAIHGHKLAEEFLRRQENKVSSGWCVFFAILAPYWGYWEEGFTMRRGKNYGAFIQFALMAQLYDQVKPDLKPAKVRYKMTQAHHYTNLSLMKQARAETRRQDRLSNIRARERNRKRKIKR